MNTPHAADIDREAITRTTAELLAAVNTSDADRSSAVLAAVALLMPPHHPSVRGRDAIAQYFRNLFSHNRFSFTFTSSQIYLSGEIAFEHVTYTATIWRGDDSPIQDAGKGLHVYRRQPNGSWKLAYDIWNSDHVWQSPSRK